MERNDRKARDAAGIGPYAQEREQLVAMSTLQSWTVSPGEADIRGWEIRTVSGRQLGSVSDFLIDQTKGEVVLLDVDLPGTDRHTFVPIRIVEIDREKRLVVMDSADLPESDLMRADHGETRGAVEEGGTVRYPAGDREVRSAPPELADSVLPKPSVADRHDRRRAERRRIERLNTDF
jgi:sporulation protein YlmC with PRC-barrel domain